MRTVKYTIGILAIGIAMLSGCGEKKETGTEATLEAEQSDKTVAFDPAMTEYQFASDNITIDAKVMIPDAAKEGMVPVANGRSIDMKAKIEDLKSDFFSTMDSESLNYEEIEGGFFSLEGSKSKEDWMGMAYNNSSSISVNSSEAQYRLNCIVREDYDENYNGELYQQKEDLPFMSHDMAADQVREILKKYGITLGELVNVYAMDYETMKEQEDTTGINGEENFFEGKAEWSQEDDTYYLFFHQMFQGFPVIYQPYAGNGFADGEAANVMFDKDGIIEADIEGCFSWEISEEKEIIPVQKAAKTVQENYGGILEMKYQLEKVSLMLDIIPETEGTAKLCPVWYFQGKVISEGNQTDTAITIDAVSGKEIMS